MKKLPIHFIITLVLITACSTEKPLNLTTAREEVKNYYESGKFSDEVKAVIEEAKTYFNDQKVSENSVIIFDVDDTALSNYHISKMVGFGYVHEIIQEEVLKGNSPAIPVVKELYDFVKHKGYKTIFLTGRKDFEYDATYNNLVSEGFTEFDTLIVRMQDEYEISAVEYKSQKRKDLNEAGYEIEGTIGDQWSDLEGPLVGKTFKIPNYLYLVN